MRICLLFLSLVFAALELSAGAEVPAQETYASGRYVFDVSMEKGHLSGIMIVREQGDAIVGTMVNEFGITVLSFVYEPQRNKIKLENVVGFLNKWYIKRVLKTDIRYCLQILYGMSVAPKKHYTVSESQGGVVIANTKRKIEYSFSPLIEPAYEIEE